MQKRALIVFLKHPEPGMVKTRLARDVGVTVAANIYRRFVDAALRKAKQITARRFIFYAPKGKKRAIESSYGKGFVYCLQRGKDLGQRLLDAARRVQKLGFRRTVIIGTDSPTMPLAFIDQAFLALEEADLVIGPCIDGGYYLIGFNKPFRAIFEKIDWSSSEVFEQTLRSASRLKLKSRVLPQWYDVDTLRDLERMGSREADANLQRG